MVLVNTGTRRRTLHSHSLTTAEPVAAASGVCANGANLIGFEVEPTIGAGASVVIESQGGDTGQYGIDGTFRRWTSER